MALAQFRSRMAAWRLRHPALTFWVVFALLNFLLFLPLALLTRGGDDAPPLFGEGARLGLERLFIWRQGLDPLRLSMELTRLTALWVWVRRLRGCVLRVITAAVYLLALVYAIYEAVLLAIWLLEPNFYSQIQLARDGLPFLLGHVGSGWWMAAGALAALLLAGAGIVLLIQWLLDAGAHIGPVSRGAIAVAALLCVAALLRYQYYTAQPEMVLSSLGYKIERNVAASRALAQDVRAFDSDVVAATYDYSPYRLARTPNIYLIFIESYGSVLYKRPDFKIAYTALLRDLDKQLAGAGWHARSALSRSPTWGGGSWMAYSSALLGIHIDNHPQYLSLLNKYQVETYPSLARTLEGMGYRFAWLSALDDDYSDLAWQRLIRFYGIETLLRRPELNYSGPGYGWGPAPPDQYTLNEAFDLLDDGSDQPLFLFTITQNSHYPWVPQPVLVDDWRSLTNRPDDESPTVDPDAIEQSERRQNYLRAVRYQLQNLTELIEQRGDDNSLFILIGDHQPPVVSRRSDGWETPVHIISRDPALVDAFAGYGFTPGLAVTSMQPALNHEGFYSLLMRVLVEQFGAPAGTAQAAGLPAFLPQGALPMHAADALEADPAAAPVSVHLDGQQPTP